MDLRRHRERDICMEPRKTTQALPHRVYSVNFYKTDHNGIRRKAKRYFKELHLAQRFSDIKKAERESLGNLAFGLSDRLKLDAIECQRRLAPYGKSLVEAVTFFIETQRLEETCNKTAQQAFDLYCRHCSKMRLSDKHIINIESNVGRFCKSFGSVKVATIKENEVQKWLDDWRTKDGRTLQGHSYNTVRTYLSGFFNFCISQKLMPKDSNPVSGIKPMSKKALKRNGKVPRLLSPEDLIQLIKATPESLRPTLVLQAFCGVRAAEVCRLEWDDIRTSGELRIPASKAKTARARFTPIPKTALDFLNMYRQPSGYIFGGELPLGIDALQRALSIVRKSIPEVKWQRNALRASALSYRLALTRNLSQTANEMGNSPTVLQDTYWELTDSKTAEDWFSVNPSIHLSTIRR